MPPPLSPPSPPVLTRGRYRARLDADAGDLRRAQRLRWLCFVGSRGRAEAGTGEGLDADRHDSRCRHLLVEDVASGALVSCCRLMLLEDGGEIGETYAAQHYDLGALGTYPGRMLEIGRFCIHPDWHDPGILRLAWAALARIVDVERAGLVFGCSSFLGTDPAAHADAFAMLRAHHLAPSRWLPGAKAPQVFAFGRQFERVEPDPRRARDEMPPLLRSYLAMGGWVSDHAVVDPELGTLHVFTGVEVGDIPERRWRLMREAGR